MARSSRGILAGRRNDRKSHPQACGLQSAEFHAKWAGTVSADTRSVIDRAKRVYAERLRAAVENDHRGRFVPIEPESGDYFLADTLDTMNNERRRHTSTRRQFAGTLLWSPLGHPDLEQARHVGVDQDVHMARRHPDILPD
jgi:hypothetical protein